jgi:hypothetical protein
MDASSRIHKACDALWPEGSVQNAVKHASAVILSEQPSYCSTFGGLGSKLYTYMGSDFTNKMLRAAGAAKNIRQLLLEDPAFSVVEKRGTGHGHDTVRLNVDYVLTHAPVSISCPCKP